MIECFEEACNPNPNSIFDKINEFGEAKHVQIL